MPCYEVFITVSEAFTVAVEADSASEVNDAVRELIDGIECGDLPMPEMDFGGLEGHLPEIVDREATHIINCQGFIEEKDID